MPPPPRFSVVVPTQGDPARLAALIDALSRQTLAAAAWEVILASDRARLDPAIEAAALALPAPTRIVSAGGGPGAGRNRGAEAARGEWLAFTEDDCTPAPDWLERAAARLAATPEAEVIAGATRKPGDRPIHRQIPGAPLYLPTNLFVRRDVFARAGGYREDYFDPGSRVYFREDSDFGFTLEALGARIVEAPEARVEHPEEHPSFLDPLRWARRHAMDPLLAARHPERFRTRIEVHRIGPLTIRRPIVRASIGAVMALLGAAIAALAGHRGLSAALLAVAIACLVVVWAKWRFDPRRLPVVPLVPFVLALALLRGAWRARGLSASAREPVS